MPIPIPSSDENLMWYDKRIMSLNSLLWSAHSNGETTPVQVEGEAPINTCKRLIAERLSTGSRSFSHLADIGDSELYQAAFLDQAFSMVCRGFGYWNIISGEPFEQYKERMKLKFTQRCPEFVANRVCWCLNSIEAHFAGPQDQSDNVEDFINRQFEGMLLSVTSFYMSDLGERGTVVTGRSSGESYLGFFQRVKSVYDHAQASAEFEEIPTPTAAPSRRNMSFASLGSGRSRPQTSARPFFADMVRDEEEDGVDDVFESNEEEADEMATIGELFGRNPDPSSVTPHPLVVGTGRVGVELEVEGLPNPPSRMKYWTLHTDGSLRNNGIEFVFSGPMGGQDAFAAIAELDSLLYRRGPDLSIRCSTHVHVDVRDMSIKQVKRMLLAYAYFESFLFRQSGYYRFKSNFCMPLAKAEGMVEILGRHWHHRNEQSFIRYAQSEWDKYCSVNLLPMGSYGSIEFRMSEAKSRKGQLIRLVNRFLALRELALNVELDDVEFIRHIASLDIRKVFRKGLTMNGFEVLEEDFKIGSMIAHDICCRGKIRG